MKHSIFTTIGQFSILYGNIPFKQRVSQFALWIDGVCYGVFSRVRDAMRKYRKLDGSLEGFGPAWIETVDTGKIVKRIVGEFTYAD